MTRIEQLEAALTRTYWILRYFEQNYEHDEFAHRYLTVLCRVCSAEKGMAEIDAALAAPDEGCPDCRNNMNIARLERKRGDRQSDLLYAEEQRRFSAEYHRDTALAEVERLRAEVERLRRWQESIADGTGYILRAEGQGGYEAADPETIIAAWRRLEREADAAADVYRRGAEAMREAAVKEIDCIYNDCDCRGDMHAKTIRALSIPEDK